MELEIEEAGRARRWIGAGVAILLLVAGAGSAAWLLATGGPGGIIPAPQSTPFDLNPHVTAKVAVGAFPNSVAEAAGSIWVAVQHGEAGQPDTLVRVDIRTDRVLARIVLPSFPESLVGADGSVWASGYEHGIGNVLYRIDPATNHVISRIRGASGYLAAGGGSVWALGTTPWTRSIVRIDPATNRIASTISLDKHIYDLVFGAGRLWVLTDHPAGGRNNGEVVEIDPKTNAVVARIPVQNGSIWMAVGGGYVWLQGTSGIVRIDIRRGRPVGPAIPFDDNFRTFAFGKGGVWFVGGPQQPDGLCRFNAQTLRVDVCAHPGAVGDLEASHPVFVLDRRSGTIWMSNYRHTLTHIDLR